MALLPEARAPNGRDSAVLKVLQPQKKFPEQAMEKASQYAHRPQRGRTCVKGAVLYSEKGYLKSKKR